MHHPHDHHNLYKSVDLKPGQFFEMVIKNTDPKSVLTWDFDVLKHDIMFCIYKTNNDIQANTNGLFKVVRPNNQILIFPFFHFRRIHVNIK